jgi:exopolysaccharide biosynthesis polyprenyl glycosylphosphotransferase
MNGISATTAEVMEGESDDSGLSPWHERMAAPSSIRLGTDSAALLQELPLLGEVVRGASRRERLRAPHLRAVLAWIDVIGSAVAVTLALAWTGTGWEQAPALLALPVLALALLHARGAYSPALQLLVFQRLSPLLSAVTVGGMASVALGELLWPADAPSSAAVLAWLLMMVAVVGTRLTLGAAEYVGRARGRAAPAIIVGAGAIGHRVARRLSHGSHHRLRPIGFVDDDPMLDRADDLDLSVIGSVEELPRLVQAHAVEHIVVAFTSAPDETLVSALERCSSEGVTVSLVPRMFDSFNDRAACEELDGLPLLTLRRTDPKGWQFALKHALDVCAAAAALVALAPMLAVIALAIRLSSRGPVLYLQTRVGRDGQTFEMLKFRSMRIGPAQTFVPEAGCAPGGVEGSDRRTPIGRFLRKTSLDELPQLINVIRGEMSLVGPRPERPEFVEVFSAGYARYPHRHRVRSGITGLSQVRGLRGQTSLAERTELDNFYIENWSFLLDVKLMFMTCFAMLSASE